MRKSLINCSLFRGLGVSEIEQLLNRHRHSDRSYAKGEVIALKDSRYGSLMIIERGKVAAETTDRQQNVLKVDRIYAPALISPANLFAEDNRLPFDLTAKSMVDIIRIDSDELCAMMAGNVTVMKNFLEIISSQNKLVSENIAYLTYKTIKGKFASYVLDKTEDAGSGSFRNPLTQREMADLFGVTRPALARAIGELVKEGTIYVKGKQIDVLFSEKLKQYLK